MKVVHVDQKPCIALTNNVEAHLYDENIGIAKLVGQDSEEKSIDVTVQKIRVDDASITEEFEELCRELANPCLLIELDD